MNSIVETVRSTLPDFVCFQEVTDELLIFLRPLLTSTGYKTGSSLQGRAYGEMIYYRAESVRDVITAQRAFDSEMGRQLHRIDSTVQGRRVTVLTGHLESCAPSAPVRKQQLREALAEVSAAGRPAVFAGDTNLGARDTGLAIPPDVRDAWEARGADPATGPTWNTTSNLNLASCKFSAKCRFDRAYFSTSHLRCVGFELTCTAPITGSGGARLHPSDHYGILTTYEFAAGESKVSGRADGL